MDELDGIPLFRGRVHFCSVMNSSDFAISKLRGSSYELLGYSFPRWFILYMWIISLVLFAWCVGAIVLIERLSIRTSLSEGDVTVTRGAKCSIAISNHEGTGIMLGSYTIPVPKSFRYTLDMLITSSDSFVRILILLALLINTCRYSSGLLPPGGHWIIRRRRAKHSMATSDGGTEIRLGSCTKCLPKYFGAHNPVLQIAHFPQYRCGVAYPYLYPMVPKCNLQPCFIDEDLLGSCSSTLCTSLDYARHKSESCNAAISEAVPMESSGHIKLEHHSVPTDSCDTAEQHCSTLNLEVIAAAGRLFASAAPQQATVNCSLLSAGFAPQDGMERRTLTKTMKISVENKYSSQKIASSEHNTRALSGLQKEEENKLVARKELADTKPEHPSIHASEPDTGRTIEAEERKAAAAWLIATAAPQHATGDRSLLSGFKPEDGLFVEAGDGSPMQALGRGSVVSDAVVLPDVWFIPGLTANLVSVSKLAELDYSVGFARTACYIRGAADGAVVGKAHAREDGMFELDFLRVPPAPAF